MNVVGPFHHLVILSSWHLVLLTSCHLVYLWFFLLYFLHLPLKRWSPKKWSEDCWVEAADNIVSESCLLLWIPCKVHSWSRTTQRQCRVQLRLGLGHSERQRRAIKAPLLLSSLSPPSHQGHHYCQHHHQHHRDPSITSPPIFAASHPDIVVRYFHLAYIGWPCKFHIVKCKCEHNGITNF